MTTKQPWLSKTLWMNLIALASLVFPQVRDWLATNPIDATAALAAANVILRFLTHGKISLGGENGGGVSALLLCCIATAVFGFSSVGCSNLRLPEGSSVSVFLLDPNSGAKGGMTYSNSAPRAVPVVVPVVPVEPVVEVKGAK